MYVSVRCVHVCTYMYVVYVCGACMHMCASHSSVLDVFCHCSPICRDRVSCWSLGSSIKLGWLASYFLMSLSASQHSDYRGMPPCAAFQCGTRNVNSGLHVCMASTLSTEPGSQAKKHLFNHLKKIVVPFIEMKHQLLYCFGGGWG